LGLLANPAHAAGERQLSCRAKRAAAGAKLPHVVLALRRAQAAATTAFLFLQELCWQMRY